MTKIAVILFPGMNCENETKRACEAVGMEADIIRWNADASVLEQYDGYVLGGGWSYEDRIRAGVVSAKDPIMLKIKEESIKGKVVLGICNGAQILIESGLVPGLKDKVEMALAPNINPKISGYYCTWVNIKDVCKRKTAFNNCINEVIAIPIAHAEGRFVTKDRKLIDELVKNGQIMFKYCDSGGKVIDEFPINPNGAVYNIAAICNKKGNVMAMMPHPERASWNRQLPYFEGRSFEENERLAPAAAIFASMKKFMEAKYKL